MKGNCCARCKEPIKDKFIFSVTESQYHQDCIKCADCSLRMVDKCFSSQDGKLYCKSDFWRRFGPKCASCCNTIEQGDWVQEVKSPKRLVYHLKCFSCQDCRKQLKEGDQYHLVDGRRLLCKQDFHQLVLSCSSAVAGAAATGNSQQQQQQHRTANNKQPMQCNTTSTNNGDAIASVNSPNSSLTTLRNFADNTNSVRKQNQPQLPAKQKLARCNNGNYFTSLVGGKQKSAKHSSDPNETDEFDDATGDNGDNGDDVDDVDDGNDGNDDNEDNEDNDDDYDDYEELEDVDRTNSTQIDDELELSAFDEHQTCEPNSANNPNRLARVRINRMLGYASARHHSDQLENDENCRGSAGDRQALKAAAANSLQASSRKRRRRNQTAAQKLASLEPGKPKMSSLSSTIKNGESILNGTMSGLQCSQQPGSLLAMQPAPPDAPMGASQQAAYESHPLASHRNQQHRQQQQQQHHSSYQQPTNRSVSSVASTGSNSSNGSGSRHAHSHGHLAQLTRQTSAQLSGLQPTVAGAHLRHQNSSAASQQHGASHKPTRVRTVLNEKQLETLRKCYATNPRPDALVKEHLVDATGLSPRVIRVWFQVSSWLSTGASGKQALIF